MNHRAELFVRLLLFTKDMWNHEFNEMRAEKKGKGEKKVLFLSVFFLHGGDELLGHALLLLELGGGGVDEGLRPCAHVCMCFR